MEQHRSDRSLAAAFNREALERWLSSVNPDFHRPFSLRRIGNGQSNLTFLATDTRGQRLVLRRPPLGHRLPSAHDVAREHRIYSALANTRVPVPPVIALTEDPAICDAQILALGYVDGTVIDDAGAVALAPDARTGVSRALVDTLKEIHALDPVRIGLDGLGAGKSYAARQLARWRTQWEQSKTRELPVVESIADALTAATPPQRETSLLHGDFHLLNVVFAPGSQRVNAVLDWELSTLGDPLADLGTLLAYWPERGELPLPGFPDTGLPGFVKPNDLISDYADRSDRDVGQIAFWHALALWKLAIIAEGVRARALDDQRNTAAGGPVDARIPEVLLARSHAIAAGLT